MARDNVLTENDHANKAYEQRVAKAEIQHRESAEQWKAARAAFLINQQTENDAVDQHRNAYLGKDPTAIEGYCDLVLSRSEYPDFMPREYEIDYMSDTKILVLDYSLPSIDALPTLVEVKYVASRNILTEKHLSQIQATKLYDELIYQVVLRTLYELFTADVVGAVEAIVLNGYVRSIDKSTGHEVELCILSIQAGRSEFMALNLAQVEPKRCFKTLMGVGSSKLHSMAAVAPIMSIHRDDRRFIDPHNVANQLDDTYNLAAMDWGEFEQLIRELFEKEFAGNGGEVKVTQASRDGGVDAVAFDPDPIRGGKIVIQAKKYTNVVSVAAVRDLYGTVLNEGATKGILVTTSDYGPDAYAFAANKPLTLLNGGHLLHVLEKHGHRARIDIPSARVAAIQQRPRRELPN